MINNKKGDITTQQIVLLIILIASFAVVLFFIFRLNLGATTEKEVCHNSVLTRGSNVVPGESIPLNCKTSYLCFTEDGSCEKMSGSFDVKKVTSDTETYDILANEMADCWWMFGEGKVNYLGEELLPKLYCSICSQITFDDSMGQIFEDNKISQNAFYNYLATTEISEGKSYLEYLNGLKNSQAIEETLLTNQSAFGEIDFNKHYSITMGVYSKISVGQWAAAGAGIATLALAVAGVAIPVIIVVAVVGGVGGHFIGTTVIGESGQQYYTPSIIATDDYDLLNCESIKTLA
ncbi:MAG: hypothetical protein M1416_00455 [Candidatus Pacearchaeota archaeon]|nr:hypothetical protein [Candidatus Pacearchaeota archaeon]